MEEARCAWMAPSDERWKRALRDLPHDVYHTPEYASLVATHQEGGEPICFLWSRGDRAFLVPLVLKPLRAEFGAPAGWCDAFSPYGYASPIAPYDVTPTELADFLAAFAQSAVEQDLVTAFIRLHPLMPLVPEVLRSAGTMVYHGSSVYADLREPEERLWQQMRPQWRQNIQHLERDGFKVRFDEWEDDYGQFVDIYRESMRRVGAPASYHFSDKYFDDLRTRLGNRLHLCAIQAPSGEIAAAAVNFATGAFVQGHLSGTLAQYMPMSPSRLLYYAGALRAKEQGYRYFHVGGGVGGANDSLFQFKAGFSRHRADVNTLRMVLNPERYRWLLDRSGRQNHEPSKYFPPYRAAS